MHADDPEDLRRGVRIDPRTLAAARRGDVDAFLTILRRHDRRLRRIASSLLGDRDLMDDALQEVAIKAARALPTLRAPDALGAWLARTTYHTCVDLLRRRRDLVIVASDDLPETVATSPDPADELASRDVVERLLAGLTPEQRVAVVLVDQEGLDYRLAAQIIGVPPGTIGSRLFKGRAALRRAVTAARLEERP